MSESSTVSERKKSLVDRAKDALKELLDGLDGLLSPEPELVPVRVPARRPIRRHPRRR